LNRVSGYTMIELIITVMVGSVLLMIAVPTFFWVTNSNRIAAEINGLVGDLQFARGEAVKEGQSVTVCVSTNGTTCANLNTWQKGWIVFSTANNLPLRVQKTFTSTDTFVASQNVGTITFNREGYAIGLANPGTLIELHATPSNNNWTRCLSINIVGMIASQTYGTTTNGVQCL
jgi:type IV fimbrial biogenesis protein FimT